MINDEKISYQEKQYMYQKMLSEGSLVERIGSFEPPKRKGYIKSKREEKIRDSLARELYLKREKIAQSIIENEREDTQVALNKALVSNGLSPNSYKYWDDYVRLLVKREGGWNIFVKALENNLSEVHVARKNYVISLSLFIIGMLASIALFSRLYGSWWGISIAIGLVGVSCASFVFYHLPMAQEYRSVKDHCLGDDKKRTDGFYPYSRVM